MDTPLNLQEAIINLQTYLRAISFVDDRIERLAIDGIFDGITENAVRSFQRTRALPATGIVDKSTWDAIYSEYKQIAKQTDRSRAINFFPNNPPDYEAVLGDEHIFVSVLQTILRELSVIYDSFPEIEISGVFDENTQKAVMEFQKISGLDVTGKVDLVTWNRLSEDFTNYANSDKT